MQVSQLYYVEEQAEDAGPVGAEQVLPLVQQAHAPPRAEVAYG